MAQYFYKSEIPNVGTATPVIAKNSEVFTKADPVTKDTSGWLKVAAAGEKIYGYMMEDYTAASDNQTVAKYKPLVVPARGQLMVYTADQACTQTDLDQYADLTGTTGAIQMNLAAGATGQFAVRAFDPDNDGSTTLVVVCAAEPQDLAFAQS